VQSRELGWMGRRFGELRLGNVRRPSARGSTRGPGSPRIAPGRNRARGTVSTQNTATLTLNAVATRGTAAAAPLRREEKWPGPYRGGRGRPSRPSYTSQALAEPSFLTAIQFNQG